MKHTTREIPSMQQRGVPALTSGLVSSKPSAPLAAPAPGRGFTVEKGIPLPSGSRLGGRYPFADMAPGDSFLAPCEDSKVKSLCSSISTAARTWVKANGGTRKFTVRAAKGGVRCWRTK